jgi:hypothetical protein
MPKSLLYLICAISLFSCGKENRAQFHVTGLVSNYENNAPFPNTELQIREVDHKRSWRMTTIYTTKTDTNGLYDFTFEAYKEGYSYYISPKSPTFYKHTYHNRFTLPSLVRCYPGSQEINFRVCQNYHLLIKADSSLLGVSDMYKVRLYSIDCVGRSIDTTFTSINDSNGLLTSIEHYTPLPAEKWSYISIYKKMNQQWILHKQDSLFVPYQQITLYPAFVKYLVKP